jgi:hypothetical protein
MSTTFQELHPTPLRAPRRGKRPTRVTPWKIGSGTTAQCDEGDVMSLVQIARTLPRDEAEVEYFEIA